MKAYEAFGVRSACGSRYEQAVGLAGTANILNISTTAAGPNGTLSTHADFVRRAHINGFGRPACRAGPGQSIPTGTNPKENNNYEDHWSAQPLSYFMPLK